MISNLNKMPEDIIQENLEWSLEEKQEVIEYIQGLDAPSSEDYESAVNLCRDLGLFQYQQEVMDSEVIGNLSLAGDYWIRGVRMTENNPTPHHNIRDLVEAIEYAVCFEQKDAISIFCEMPETIFANPSVVGIQPLVEYINVLKQYLGGNSVSANELETARQSCLSDTAEKAVQKKYSKILQGIIAIESADESALLAALSEVLPYHMLESQKGEYKEDPRAFICMSCMMLIKLARNKGMGLDLAFETPYIPVRLLG